MPTYDYRCLDVHCGELFEAQAPMAGPDPRCPVCAGQRVQKVILGTPHIRLAWKAGDRNDTGHDRLVIRAGRAGKPSPLDAMTEPKEWRDAARGAAGEKR